MTASFDGTNFLSTRLRTFGKQDFVPSYETPNGIRVEASIMLPQGRCHRLAELLEVEVKSVPYHKVLMLCCCWTAVPQGQKQRHFGLAKHLHSVACCHGAPCRLTCTATYTCIYLYPYN